MATNQRPVMPWEQDPRVGDMLPKAPRVPWGRFLTLFQWNPGEHLAIVGPTRSGKTVLLNQLVKLRTYAVVFATKPRDVTMDQLVYEAGMKVYAEWPHGAKPDKEPRRVIWPDAKRIDSARTQAPIFAEAFEAIYDEGSWNLFLDEGWYTTNMLGLGEQIKVYLLQARSLDISLIVATQRPVSVPTEIWDQSDHLFFFRESDEPNLKRIGGISWRSSLAVQRIVANLEPKQFLYVNTRSGDMYRSRVPPPAPFAPPPKHFWER
jgi:hypothetical protein